MLTEGTSRLHLLHAYVPPPIADVASMAHTQISGAVVARCGDYQTVGNHSRPTQSAVAVNADTLAPHSLCTAPSGCRWHCACVAVYYGIYRKQVALSRQVFQSTAGMVSRLEA